MNMSRRLSILVFSGVPAIVGGGIVYALFNHNYSAVFIYEVILILIVIGFASK
ncbi:MAG: hypothetical protein HQK79_08500 [Desulfobacterales bacterium]|nr:hypothetical protein [Desulfobacterales bacterium]